MKTYTVIHLRPKHAAQIARLEKQIYARKHRSGKRVIWAQLAEAEHEDENFSLGLFHGSKLVGFFLLFALKERRQMCEYFDVQMPPHLSAGQPVLYVADFGVLPAHRHAIRQFTRSWSALLASRPDIRNMSLDAFATQELADLWVSRVKFFTGLGWRLQAKLHFDDARLRQPMVWLCFEPKERKRSAAASRHDIHLENVRRLTVENEIFEVGIVRSQDEWPSLEPIWNDLVERSATPSLLQTCLFVRRWWLRFGYVSEPWIVVALRNGVPAAIAPLCVTPMHRWARTFRQLTWIHQASRAAEPLTAAADRGRAAEGALAEFIALEKNDWDYLWLSAAPDSFFAASLLSRLRAAKLLAVRTSEPAGALVVPHAAQLRTGERVELIRCDIPNTAQETLRDYLTIEKSHPHSAPVRVARGAALGFCEDLASQASSTMSLSIFYWHQEQELIGGCFGMVWQNGFYPLRSFGQTSLRSSVDLPFRVCSPEQRSNDMVVAAAPANPFGVLLHAMHIGYPTLRRIWRSSSAGREQPGEGRLSQMFSW